MGRGLGNGVGLGVAVGVGVTTGVGLGVIVEVGVGVAYTVGLGVGVALGVGVGLGKHALTTSTKRATTCWSPWSVVCTPVTRKPPSFLLETTEPRAGNWAVPSKTFTASPSRSPSEDRSCTQTGTGIRIGPPDQVNPIDRIERQRGETSSALLDYRYQGSYWFAGGVNKLPKERLWGVKIGEHDQVLVRCCVVGHTRSERRAGKNVTDDKRIRQRHAVAIEKSALEIFVHLISPGREIVASGCIHSDFTRWSGRSGGGDGCRRRERCAIASNPPKVDSGIPPPVEVACMVGELASDRVKYQRLLEPSVRDLNHISSRNTRGYPRAGQKRY